MEETEQQGRKNLDELIDETGGAAALRRRTGISDLTIRKVRRGERIPFVGTATRIAEGLGVDISEIDWPRSYATGPGERPKPPSVSFDGLYEDEQFKAAVAREVRRQMKTVSGTAAQSEPTSDS